MKYTYMLMICLFVGGLLFDSRSAEALQSVVPETGQTISYATGDDGALKPGVPWPSPRFTANGNGTVTDNLTGLIWLQNVHCTDIINGQWDRFNWNGALLWSNGLESGYCNLTDVSIAGDWRVPNIKELRSLYYVSLNSMPRLPSGHPFNAEDYDYCWTSSTAAFDTSYAWLSYVGWGDSRLDTKTARYIVWPVRGGQFGNSVMSVSPASGNYGTVAVNGSSSLSVTISNSAAAYSRLQINAITLRGSDPAQFSINPGNGSGGSCGSTTPILNPGASCTVSVSFNPTSSGPKSATLRISGSDVNAPNTDIPLSGAVLTYYNVTASVSGGNGTISSTNPVSVASGAPATFTLAPSSTYQPASFVSGTCPAGGFSGNTYTTGIITSACAVGFAFTKITYPLTVTFAGTGNGSVAVTPKPPALDCTGTCSQSFDAGTLVTLTPTPNGSSVFSGWNSCPLISGELCTLTMNAAKYLTAAFSPLADAGLKVGNTPYGTVAGASSVVASSGEISLKIGEINEALNFSRDITFTLKGGYSNDFQTQTATTTINGSITIIAGTAILDGIAIK